MGNMGSFNAAGPAPGMYTQPAYGGAPLTPPQTAVKQTAGSTIFMVLAILYSATTLLSFITGLATSNSGLAVFLSILFSVPAILLTIGMWMSFASARQPGNRLSGVGLCRGVMITCVVLICIFMAFVIIASIIWLSEADSQARRYGASLSDLGMILRYDSEIREATTVLIILFILLIAVMIFVMIYFIKLSKLCAEVRDTMYTGQNRIGGTTYVFVFTIIIIVCAVISLLFSIAANATIADISDVFSEMGLNGVLGGLAGASALGIIQSLLSIAVYICATVTLSQLKKNLMMTNGYYGGRPY